MNNKQEEWSIQLKEISKDCWNDEFRTNSRKNAIKEGKKLAKKQNLKYFKIAKIHDIELPKLNSIYILQTLYNLLNKEYADSYYNNIKNLDIKELKELENAINKTIFDWSKKYNLLSNMYTIEDEEFVIIDINDFHKKHLEYIKNR